MKTCYITGAPGGYGWYTRNRFWHGPAPANQCILAVATGRASYTPSMDYPDLTGEASAPAELLHAIVVFDVRRGTSEDLIILRYYSPKIGVKVEIR
jgi:hypothetical protein